MVALERAARCHSPPPQDEPPHTVTAELPLPLLVAMAEPPPVATATTVSLVSAVTIARACTAAAPLRFHSSVCSLIGRGGRAVADARVTHGRGSRSSGAESESAREGKVAVHGAGWMIGQRQTDEQREELRRAGRSGRDGASGSGRRRCTRQSHCCPLCWHTADSPLPLPPLARCTIVLIRTAIGRFCPALFRGTDFRLRVVARALCSTCSSAHTPCTWTAIECEQ